MDWETAYASEPLVDLAVMTHELAPTPELEGALIAGWGGEPDTPALRARLALVRALTHLYYAGLIFAVGALPGAPREISTDAPSMDAFQSDLMAGRLSMGTPSGWRTFGRISLANFLGAAQGPAFETALRRAAEG